MKFEILVSTINLKNKNLINKMNIKSNAIIINQSNYNNYEEIINKKTTIKIYSFDEQGIGLSRNNALMRTNSDIVLFADDDVKYVDNVEKIILNEFKRFKNADMIIFNVPSINENRQEYIIKKEKKVKLYNCLRYSTFRIATKTESIKKKNIYFSLLFGGGSKYGSGEDSLFIYNCIQSGLKVYTSSKIIGSVSHESSTWFNGYNEKYFKDKGALFCAISNKFAKIYSLYYLIKHKSQILNQLSFKQAKRKMYEGIKEFRNRDA